MTLKITDKKAVLESLYFMDKIVYVIPPNTLKLGEAHLTEVGNKILPLLSVNAKNGQGEALRWLQITTYTGEKIKVETEVR